MAFVAESAEVADWNLPEARLQDAPAPVSGSFFTLAPVIALAPLAFVAEPFLIFAGVTALFFNCLVPTLFFWQRGGGVPSSRPAR